MEKRIDVDDVIYITMGIMFLTLVLMPVYLEAEEDEVDYELYVDGEKIDTCKSYWAFGEQYYDCHSGYDRHKVDYVKEVRANG